MEVKVTDSFIIWWPIYTLCGSSCITQQSQPFDEASEKGNMHGTNNHHCENLEIKKWAWGLYLPTYSLSWTKGQGDWLWTINKSICQIQTGAETQGSKIGIWTHKCIDRWIQSVCYGLHIHTPEEFRRDWNFTLTAHWELNHHQQSEMVDRCILKATAFPLLNVLLSQG